MTVNRGALDHRLKKNLRKVFELKIPNRCILLVRSVAKDYIILRGMTQDVRMSARLIIEWTQPIFLVKIAPDLTTVSRSLVITIH